MFYQIFVTHISFEMTVMYTPYTYKCLGKNTHG